jgi:hypothetical protein
MWATTCLKLCIYRAVCGLLFTAMMPDSRTGTVTGTQALHLGSACRITASCIPGYVDLHLTNVYLNSRLYNHPLSTTQEQMWAGPMGLNAGTLLEMPRVAGLACMLRN